MTTTSWLVLAAAALLLAAAVAGRAWLRLEWIQRQIRRRHPGVSQMSSEELARRLAAGEPTVLVDVRRPEEFAVSHLAGARRLDPGDRQPRLPGVDPGATVVAYCSVGGRSSQMAERLAAAGYRDVHNLEGSIFKWIREGRPLVQGERQGGLPVAKVHPSSPAWAFLVPRAARAYLPEDAAAARPNS